MHISVVRVERSGFSEVHMSLDQPPLVVLENAEVQCSRRRIGADPDGFPEQGNRQVVAASGMIQDGKCIICFEIIAVPCEHLTKHVCRLMIPAGFTIPRGTPDFFATVNNLPGLVRQSNTGALACYLVDRIPVKYRSERVFEFVEMVLVMTPVFEPARVYWLANLFRARGSHGALRVVKLEASFFERQLAIIQQSPHLCFRIAYNIFILDSQYLAR